MLASDLPAVLEMDRTTPRAPHWGLLDYQNCLQAAEAPAEAVKGLLRRAWVAECGGDALGDELSGILGFAVVRGVAVGAQFECELESLVVRPEAQRRGVGSTLLAGAIHHLRAAGASLFLLEVRPSNLPAIRLYERFGFTLAGLRKGYYAGQNGMPSEDALLMQLSF